MRLCLFLLGLILPTFIWANVASLNTMLNHYRSMSAHFTQTLITQNGQLTQTSQGVLYLQKPNHFRLELNAPHAQLFVSNGITLWNEERDLDQVIKSPLSHDLSQTPLLLLSNSEQNLNALFTVSEPKANTYLLIPKTQDSLVKSITVSFTNAETLSSLVLTNTLGDTTSLQFTDVIINPTLSKQLFMFVPKADETVLNQ